MFEPGERDPDDVEADLGRSSRSLLGRLVDVIRGGDASDADASDADGDGSG